MEYVEILGHYHIYAFLRYNTLRWFGQKLKKIHVKAFWQENYSQCYRRYNLDVKLLLFFSLGLTFKLT